MLSSLLTILNYIGMTVFSVAALTAGLVVMLPAISSLFHVGVTRDILSQNGRQIEIQGMIHIGSSQFYDEIRELVSSRLAQGYLVLYEGVAYDGPPEEKREITAKLWKRLNINIVLEENDDRSIYAILAPMLGSHLVSQDNRKIGLEPSARIINADVTVSQILSNVPEIEVNSEEVNLAELSRKFAEMPGWIQRRLSACIRMFFSYKISRTKGKLPEYIRTGRENVVLDYVRMFPDENILIVYGDHHRAPIGNAIGRMAEGVAKIDSVSVKAW